MKRMLWFITMFFEYLSRAAALTLIVYVFGFVLGILAGAFGSSLFNWITGGVFYVAGIFYSGNDDPLPSMMTLLTGGYITGQIVRVIIAALIGIF